jgi:hypothetical protein
MGQGFAVKRIRRKQIVYRFNGDPKYDEVVSDRVGELPFRRVGETLTRNGKRWMVVAINNDLNIEGSSVAIPIHHVFLTENFQ